MSKENVCCINCRFFEEKTYFCRLNPPTPSESKEQKRNGKEKIISRYPRIMEPQKDWCSHFKEKMF